MKCADLRERVAPLLDGELGASESRTLEDHLAECEACANFVEELARQPLGSKYPPPMALPRPWTSLDEALDRESERSLGRLSRARAWLSRDIRVPRAWALATLVLLLFLATLALRPGARTSELPGLVSSPANTPAEARPGSERSNLVPVSHRTHRQVY